MSDIAPHAGSPTTLLDALPEDAQAIAALHVESWRSAYRGMLPDAFLDGPVEKDRQDVWRTRLAHGGSERQLVIKAVAGEALVGFVCVLLDEAPALGPLLDNLHVKPEWKGRGVGRRLFDAARAWVADAAPGEPMHLWVIEANLPARRFYDRLGGTVAAREVADVVGSPVARLRYVWPAASIPH